MSGPPVGWWGNPPLVEVRCAACTRKGHRSVLAGVWARWPEWSGPFMVLRRPTDWAGEFTVTMCPAHGGAKRSDKFRAADTDKTLRRGVATVGDTHPTAILRAAVERAERLGRMQPVNVEPPTVDFPSIAPNDK